MTSEQMKSLIREGLQFMLQVKTKDALRFNHGYSNGQIGLAASAMLVSREDADMLFNECDEIYKKAFDKLQH